MKKWLTIMLGLLCIVESSIAQQINQIEYFFDKDSGVAKGNNLTSFSTADTVRIINATVSVPQLANGMHTMYVRAKSDSGWSQYTGAFFYIRKDIIGIEPPIDSAEYFIDKDLGAGKCTSLSIGVAKDTVTLSTVIPINNLSAGFHTMGIRVKNMDGKYSHYATQMFYVSNDINNMPPIISGEYFIDHDPGIGLGESVTKFNFSTPASSVSQVFNLQLPSGTDTGKHYMYVRVKDAAGHWSLFQDSFKVFTLPITGLSLSAEKRNKNVLLNWYTLTESNTKHFEAEKSVNGISFAGIGKAKAKGNSNIRSNYNFTDFEPANGLNFYRIKEIDNDGKFVYSQIVKIWFDKGKGTLSIYPNPASNVINIKYESSSKEAFVNLYDAQGRWVKLSKLPVNSNLQLDISGLSSGTYTVHISDGLTLQTGKFIKK